MEVDMVRAGEELERRGYTLAAVRIAYGGVEFDFERHGIRYTAEMQSVNPYVRLANGQGYYAASRNGLRWAQDAVNKTFRGRR